MRSKFRREEVIRPLRACLWFRGGERKLRELEKTPRFFSFFSSSFFFLSRGSHRVVLSGSELSVWV